MRVIAALPEWIGALLQAKSRPHDPRNVKLDNLPSPGNPYDVDPIHSLKGDDLHIPPSPYPSPQRGEEKSLFYPSPQRGEEKSLFLVSPTIIRLEPKIYNVRPNWMLSAELKTMELPIPQQVP